MYRYISTYVQICGCKQQQQQQQEPMYRYVPLMHHKTYVQIHFCYATAAAATAATAAAAAATAVAAVAAVAAAATGTYVQICSFDAS